MTKQDILKRLPQAANLFVTHVTWNCRTNGVKLRLVPRPDVRFTRKIRVTGWFSHVKPELVCAIGGQHWIETLVHEYAHMTQWLDSQKTPDQCPIWSKNVEMMGHDDWVVKWVHGETVEHIDSYIELVRDLELDNEKRTVQLITEWGLDTIIDVPHYIKAANAYILWHNWLKTSRTWLKPGNKNLVYNSDVLNMMSTQFDMDYNTLSAKLIGLFTEIEAKHEHGF